MLLINTYSIPYANREAAMEASGQFESWGSSGASSATTPLGGWPPSTEVHRIVNIDTVHYTTLHCGAIITYTYNSKTADAIHLCAASDGHQKPSPIPHFYPRGPTVVLDSKHI